MSWGQSNKPVDPVEKTMKAYAKVTPEEMADALKNIKKNPAAYLKVVDKQIASGEFPDLIAKKQNSYISRMGKWWSVLKLLGFAEASYQLWAHLTVLDQNYMSGQRSAKVNDPTGLTTNMPGNASIEFNEQDYKDWRKYYIGLWEAQVALPLVVSIIKKASNLLLITRTIISVLSLAGSAVTFGSTLIFGLATEALTTGIQAFLMSPAGQEWAVENLFSPLCLAGEVGESAWLLLYKGVTGVLKAIDSGNASDITKGDNFYADKKSERDKNPELAKRDAALGDVGDVYTGKNAVIVGGVRITDQNGYLLPGIEAVPSVKDALEYGSQAEKDAFAKAKAKGTNYSNYYNSKNPAVINSKTGKVADRDPVTGKLVDRP